MSRLYCFFWATLFLVPAAAQAGNKSCNLARYVDIDMSPNPAGMVVVPAKIDDKPLQMLVDTGGIITMLSRESEDALGLGRIGMPQSEMGIYGKIRILSYVRAPGIVLGHIQLPPMEFQTLPENLLPQTINGIIAPNILSAFDVEFDFAKNKFELFSQDHCPGKAVYWTHDPHAAIPIKITKNNQILVTVQLDGKDVLATIDTGSTNSEMSLETAEKLFGFDTSSPLLKSGWHKGRYTHYHYPFKSLSMQGVSVKNPDLTLISDDESGFETSAWWGVGNFTPRIILGMNILRQLHLYIAYKEKVLYATAAEAH